MEVPRLPTARHRRFIQVGMMCCSPQRAGFKASFADFAVGPAIARELHD
jgi:regulation of enolase protein 1 (concanavalin A-like superfamily)